MVLMRYLHRNGTIQNGLEENMRGVDKAEKGRVAAQISFTIQKFRFR